MGACAISSGVGSSLWTTSLAFADPRLVKERRLEESDLIGVEGSLVELLLLLLDSRTVLNVRANPLFFFWFRLTVLLSSATGAVGGSW